MKTLVKTSMIACMALAIVFMTVPFGHTQEVTTPKTLCPKCGVATTVEDCSYGPLVSRIGPYPRWPRNGIDACGKLKPAATLTPHAATEPVRAFGQSPAWGNGEETVCHECGKGFRMDERLRQVTP